MLRWIEKTGDFVLILLIGKYKGDINKIPIFREKFIQLADTPRYRLFHQFIPKNKIFFQVSQGKTITDPEKIMITCFGEEKDLVNQEIDNFLKETKIIETEVPLEELQIMAKAAKVLTSCGMKPSWMS